MGQPVRVLLAAMVLVLGGCGGSGDPLPAGSPEASAPVATPTPTPSPAVTPTPVPTATPAPLPTPMPTPSPSPSPSPSVGTSRLFIGGERVTEPHTFEVTREADAQGNAVRHRFVIEIPGRGWQVRFFLPTAPFVTQTRDQNGNVTEERLVEPEHEQWRWCMGGTCGDFERPVIERFVMGGVEYGVHGLPAQGAADPCSNGTWRRGDPPAAENRLGAISGVTERLTPTAEGTLHFLGRDDECRWSDTSPGVEVTFIAPAAR